MNFLRHLYCLNFFYVKIRICIKGYASAGSFVFEEPRHICSKDHGFVRVCRYVLKDELVISSGLVHRVRLFVVYEFFTAISKTPGNVDVLFVHPVKIPVGSVTLFRRTVSGTIPVFVRSGGLVRRPSALAV